MEFEKRTDWGKFERPSVLTFDQYNELAEKIRKNTGDWMVAVMELFEKFYANDSGSFHTTINDDNLHDNALIWEEGYAACLNDQLAVHIIQLMRVMTMKQREAVADAVFESHKK
ncbi:MAG TPA: hypothetical protein VGQ59_21270 [Cyclobacteriaceae bacterium]|nr:hypothetical protein [Cyclobacteriaceae bacterium]